MILIVALGNPGEEYVQTRHNVGWMVMRDVVTKENLPSPVSSRKYQADISEGVLAGRDVSVLFPQTFMNNSGASVRTFLSMRIGDPVTLVVVHDEIDLPFGEIKISKDRGAGGHNGVRSIVDAVGTQDFVRVRVGIAPRGIFGTIKRPKGEKLPKFVLADFKPAELRALPDVSEKVHAALRLLVEQGTEKAMQVVNK